MQCTKITLTLAMLLTTVFYCSSAGAGTVQKTIDPLVQPKQFDDPLFKPKDATVQPKQFDDPLFKPKDATVQPKQFDDPLFKPKD